jgi:hypothetical protein
VKGIGLMPRTNIEQEVVVKTTIEVATNIVALDATNASELIAKLNSTRDAIKAQQDAEKALKAELYSLMGYTLVNDEWVGTAEVGTIAGITVAKVATVNATKLNKEKLFAENPNAEALLKAYTEPAPYKALKIGK